MVSLQIEGDRLVCNVERMDRLWSLKSRLEVPLTHIRGAEPADDEARELYHGLRVGGLHVPGLSAGSFYHDGGLVFWDVHDPERAISIELADERYRRLVIEVEDPVAAISIIQTAIRAAEFETVSDRWPGRCCGSALLSPTRRWGGR
jgi:hypothetical protein